MNGALGDIASVSVMGWIRRRRNLRLRPLSELHEEFSARPQAQSMLDEAEDELASRERQRVPQVDQRS